MRKGFAVALLLVCAATAAPAPAMFAQAPTKFVWRLVGVTEDGEKRQGTSVQYFRWDRIGRDGAAGVDPNGRFNASITVKGIPEVLEDGAAFVVTITVTANGQQGASYYIGAGLTATGVSIAETNRPGAGAGRANDKEWKIPQQSQNYNCSFHAQGAPKEATITPFVGAVGPMATFRYERREETITAPGSNLKYREPIQRAAQQYRVNPALVAAIIKASSDFDPSARGQAGGVGLMLLPKEVIRALGVIDALNPEQNIDAGAHWFSQLLVRYGGDESKAIAAFNCGPSRLDRAGGIPPDKETQEFVKNILKYKAEYGSLF